MDLPDLGKHYQLLVQVELAVRRGQARAVLPRSAGEALQVLEPR
jgi:hypothetical protein